MAEWNTEGSGGEMLEEQGYIGGMANGIIMEKEVEGWHEWKGRRHNRPYRRPVRHAHVTSIIFIEPMAACHGSPVAGEVPQTVLPCQP